MLTSTFFSVSEHDVLMKLLGIDFVVRKSLLGKVYFYYLFTIFTVEYNNSMGR